MWSLNHYTYNISDLHLHIPWWQQRISTSIEELKRAKHFVLVIKSPPYEGAFVDDNGVNSMSLEIVRVQFFEAHLDRPKLYWVSEFIAHPFVNNTQCVATLHSILIRIFNS